MRMIARSYNVSQTTDFEIDGVIYRNDVSDANLLPEGGGES
jgi:hypothetical protein